MSTDLRDKVLLSIQRALLGKIETSVRGICININNNTLDVNAYYDTLPSTSRENTIKYLREEVIKT